MSIKSDSMFHDLKDVLTRRLRQQGIGQAVEAAQVVAAFRKAVKELLGERAERELRKVALRDFTLEVLASSGALASELRMREADIREKLKNKLGKQDYKMRIFG